MFPAPAGINRHCRPQSEIRIRVPRASGDKPPFIRWQRRC
ncbi:hypothetical protein CIT292_09838 [Citrobacter youngae ATCC 29220]|uniref:Uncharacterized protein n=1 Tax=Citrobacter youngae ATCC 29220 TaxID=500640 RepID=D4BH31_9ENTR|nr:hypothetical protein CIT292_09838 [Citrobacter youngae ATCC 29220]